MTLINIVLRCHDYNVTYLCSPDSEHPVFTVFSLTEALSRSTAFTETSHPSKSLPHSTTFTETSHPTKTLFHLKISNDSKEENGKLSCQI